MPDRENVIAMAKQCGFARSTHGIGLDGKAKLRLVFDETKLVEFAALVAAQEREANAKLCERSAKQISDPLVLGDEAHAAGVNVCINLARAIRARKEET